VKLHNMSVVVLLYDKIDLHVEALEAMICVALGNLDRVRPNKLANTNPDLMIDASEAQI